MLLLLVVLGSLPKKYLHDALAGHEDVAFGFKGKDIAVSESSYQCGFDHQVAESPFIEATDFAVPTLSFAYLPIFLSFHYTDAVPGFNSAGLSRGPPAARLLCR